jgi:hypothetical protein
LAARRLTIISPKNSTEATLRYTGRAFFVGLCCFAALTAGARAAGASARDAAVAARELEAAGQKPAARVLDHLVGRSVRQVPVAQLRAEALRLTQRLGETERNALLAGADPAPLVAAVAAPRLVTAPVLGESDNHLLFVPVAPCRLIDTRLSGGALAAGETRSFQVAGTSGFDDQGGTLGGCGVPIGAAEPMAPAVVINFVAVSPSGPGHLRAWEHGQPIPGASTLNYQQLSPTLNIANALVVSIAGTSVDSADLDVQAGVSGTHLVADVTGYFTRFPVEEIPKPFVNAQGGQMTVNLWSIGCYEVLSCTMNTTAASGRVIVQVNSQFDLNHTSGTADTVQLGIEVADPVTCPEGSHYSRRHEVPADRATDEDVYFELSMLRAFSQAAWSTQTYRTSVKMLSGDSDDDWIRGFAMICTFIPD